MLFTSISPPNNPKCVVIMELERCTNRTWCIWISTARFVWMEGMKQGYWIENGDIWNYAYICFCGELRYCTVTVTTGSQLYSYSSCMSYLALYKTVPRDFEWNGYVAWARQAVNEMVY